MAVSADRARRDRRPAWRAAPAELVERRHVVDLAARLGGLVGGGKPRCRPGGSSSIASPHAAASANSPSQRRASACTSRSAPSASPFAPQANACSHARDAPAKSTPRALARRPRGYSSPARAGSPARSRVLAEHHRVGLARALEPRAGEPVAERAVGVGEHRVRGLAHERVAEHELVLAGKARRAARARSARAATSSSSHASCSSSSRRRASARTPPRQNALAEHARRAQHAARLGVEPLEPRLHHREHRLGQRVAPALGHRADQLLEVERVAGGALDDARDRARPRAVAEHLAHEPLAALLRRARRAGSPARPRSAHRRGKTLVDLGPREREHEQRPIAQRRAAPRRRASRSGRRPSADPRARSAAAARRTRRRRVLERAADLVAHQHAVGARGAQLDPSSSANGAADRARRGTRDARDRRLGALRATRARSLSRRTSSGSPSRMPAARRSACARSRTASPRSSDRRGRARARRLAALARSAVTSS